MFHSTKSSMMELLPSSRSRSRSKWLSFLIHGDLLVPLWGPAAAAGSGPIFNGASTAGPGPIGSWSCLIILNQVHNRARSKPAFLSFSMLTLATHADTSFLVHKFKLGSFQSSESELSPRPFNAFSRQANKSKQERSQWSTFIATDRC